MAQSFPTSVPSYPDTTGSEALGTAGSGKGLSGILDDYGLDIAAVATKIGTGSSTPTSGKVLRASGTGTSVWGAVVLTTDVTGILPVANGGTGLSALGTNVSSFLGANMSAGTLAFLGTPSSANLATAITDETGSGAVVFGTSPTLTTPTIGDFTNAQHTHANAANGGTLGSNTVGAIQITNQTVSADKMNLGPAAAFVTTDETTTSVTYADLTTTSDTVTVTIGANGLALVALASGVFNSAANDTFVSFAVSGATTTAATDTMCIRQATSSAMGWGATFLVTGLNAGSTTFKMKYRVSAGTGHAFNRRIAVVPL
jgi:hypothetical protein